MYKDTSFLKRIAGAITGFIQPRYIEPGHTATVKIAGSERRHLVQHDSIRGYEQAGIKPKAAMTWCNREISLNPFETLWAPYGLVSCGKCFEEYAKVLQKRADEWKILSGNRSD